MAIKIRRTGIFFVGLAIIFSYFLFGRLQILFSSNKTSGIIVSKDYGMVIWDNSDKFHSCAKFENEYFGTLYTNNPDTDLKPGEKVTIVYNKKSPAIAYIYNLYAFWVRPMLYSIILLLPWAAFVWGYVNPNKVVEIKFPFGKSTKSA